MNIVCQLFYQAYNYVSLFLIIFLTKAQATNNRLLTLCQYQGPQHRPPLWNRALQWTLINTNAFYARMIIFLTPRSAIIRTKDPTVVTNDFKRLHSELRHVDHSAVLRHVPEPVVVPQLLTDTDHFEHSSVTTRQLLSELKTPPSLNHIPAPVVEPRLRSNTDHFEHQTVNSDQLNEEIRNHPPLHHVAQPPEPQTVLVSDTDHFEHVDVDTTERLLEEIKSVNRETLNHVSELPARVAQTDIEFLHAALEAHKV